MNFSRFKKITGHSFRSFYLWVIIVTTYIPILVVIIWSFNESGFHESYNSRFTSWSTKAYENLFAAQDFWDSFLNSLIIATSAALFSTLLGLITALSIRRNQLVIRKSVYFVSNVSMVNPDIITAVSIAFVLTSIWLPLGLSEGYLSAIAANVSYGSAYSLFLIHPRLQKLDQNTIDAAHDLGNNSFKTFYKVTFPFLLPALASSLGLTFAWSFNDFIITRIALGNNIYVSTVTIDLFTSSYKGIKTYYFAFGALIIAITILIAFLTAFWPKRKNRKISFLRTRK